MRREVRRAISLLKKGELVVYPTDTIYGLGADIFNEGAVRRVYKIKNRPFSMPLSIALSSIDEINEFAFMNSVAEKVANYFMPGPITIILKKKKCVPDIVALDKVGIRVPECEIAQEIANEVKITATSANIHGGKNPCTIEEAKKQLGSEIALYMDGGRLPCIPSTVVDLSNGEIRILREGEIKRDDIYGIL